MNCITNVINEDSMLLNNWAMSLCYNNVYPITLCPAPPKFDKDQIMNEVIPKMCDYCLSRSIEFVLYKEQTPLKDLTHFHGIIQYPSEKHRRQFKTWWCKNYGKYHESKVTEFTNFSNWENYCKKDQNSEIPIRYMFDD